MREAGAKTRGVGVRAVPARGAGSERSVAPPQVLGREALDASAAVPPRALSWAATQAARDVEEKVIIELSGRMCPACDCRRATAGRSSASSWLATVSIQALKRDGGG